MIEPQVVNVWIGKGRLVESREKRLEALELRIPGKSLPRSPSKSRNRKACHIWTIDSALPCGRRHLRSSWLSCAAEPVEVETWLARALRAAIVTAGNEGKRIAHSRGVLNEAEAAVDGSILPR